MRIPFSMPPELVDEARARTAGYNWPGRDQAWKAERREQAVEARMT